MHLEHVPGERMQVDFAGKKLSYVDMDSGELKRMPCVGYGALPFSGYTYVEALVDASQKKLYEALGRAFELFWGCPCKCTERQHETICRQGRRYEPCFNELAEQWSVYYNTTLSAARIRRPKDKPSVEKKKCTISY